MQSIFDKFSLQNLLRQFFCGFVFIASFWFFSGGNTTEDLAWSHLEGFLNGIHWELSQLIALAVAACIIGTIIYHLEKNLYSYSMQAFFEWRDSCSDSSSESQKKISTLFWFVLFLVFFFLIFCGLEGFPLFPSSFWFCILVSCFLLFVLVGIVSCLIFLFISSCTFSPWILSIAAGAIGYFLLPSIIPCLWISFFLVALFFVWPCMFRKVIERTQKIWIIETGTAERSKDDVKGDLQSDLSDKKAIAQKLATWSDFIHCTQSCCFAWIVGCWVTKCWIFKCGLVDGLCAACEEPSVRGAFLILLLELLFDWHRYQHVLDITKAQTFSPASKEEQSAAANPADSKNTNNN